MKNLIYMLAAMMLLGVSAAIADTPNYYERLQQQRGDTGAMTELDRTRRPVDDATVAPDTGSLC